MAKVIRERASWKMRRIRRGGVGGEKHLGERGLWVRGGGTGLAGAGAERRAAGGILLQPTVWYHGCSPWPGLQCRLWWLECL